MAKEVKNSRLSARNLNRNNILAGLPKREYDRIAPLLKTVSLPAGRILQDVDEPIINDYFVTSGLISMVTLMSNGDCVEVGIVGNEGFTGLPMLLGIPSSSSRLNVQISGDALQIDSNALRKLLAAVPLLEVKLARFSYLQALQMAQIAACNRLHEVGERLSRWLLMVQDRIRTNVVPLTHEFLGNMLGSRRASVTIAAGMLHKAGIIEYRRGWIHILNRQKLEETACECYEIVHEQFKAYLKPEVPARSRIATSA